jgi:hypothetical protein
VLRADDSSSDIADQRKVAGPDPVDRPELPDRAIVTLRFAHGLGRLETEVVLRADGTPWPLDLLLAAGRPDQDEEHPVLLVDLDDVQDVTARDATRARRQVYVDRGWLVIRPTGGDAPGEDDQGRTGRGRGRRGAGRSRP